MKRTLLIAVLAVFGISAFAQTEPVTINPTADTFVRKGKTDNNGGKTYIEVENTSDGTGDFVGLMSFTLPETPSGMKISSATLRLTTKRVKQSRATVSLFAYAGEWAENAKYEDQEANVQAARATNAIATFTPEGQLNKDVSSDEITTEKYQVITGWQNSIDLTAYVKGITASTFSIMIDANADKGQLQFFSKEATAFENAKTAIANADADLMPQLVITYEKDADSKNVTELPTADTLVRKGKTDNNGTKTYIELQNATDGSYDFVGLMSFALPVEDDMEVTKATLRLTTKRVKQSRATVSLFAYTGEWAENAKYEDQEANVMAARATTALATFTPEGQLNKDVSSDEITTEKYQIITGWQNSIDLTEYVKGLTGSSFSIMLDANADKGQLQFFSKEATAFENANTAIANTDADLVPQLTVTLSKKGDPTGIQTVETKTVNVQEGIYTLSGQRVDKMGRGIYIVNGKKIINK